MSIDGSSFSLYYILYYIQLNTGQFNASLVGRDDRVQRVWLQGETGCSIIVAVVDGGKLYIYQSPYNDICRCLSESTVVLSI